MPEEANSPGKTCPTETRWQIAIQGERLDIAGKMSQIKAEMLIQRMAQSGLTLIKRYVRSPCICHRICTLTFSRDADA